MKHPQKQKGKKISLKKLKAKLRNLPEVEIPCGLVGDLLAAIPQAEAKVSCGYQHTWFYKRGFLVTAAVVLISASVFMVSYAFILPSGSRLIDFNDIPPGSTWRDQNSLLYDQNTASLSKSLSYKVNWPVINQNEPLF